MNRQLHTNVLVGVTGSIAAYKACEIVRNLQKAGLHVKVVMTRHALEFVGAATFRALTGEPVAIDLFDEASEPIHHISLAKEIDVYLIAPATANVIAKIARGVADDLLTTTALATNAPIVIAPAMNTEMWFDQATQDNIAELKRKGFVFVEPANGELACGDEGAGKLEDSSVISSAVLEELRGSSSLSGKKVVVTAGPTREAIDPVRYLTNRSSGRMGYEIAREAVKRGADVVLISGPTSVIPPRGATVIAVDTALKMHEVTLSQAKDADIVVGAAAVSDYRCARVSSEKIKRNGESIELELIPNPDIIADVCAGRTDGRPFVVAFAAETENFIENGFKKLKSKGVDMVALNDVGRRDIGFDGDENEITVLTEQGSVELQKTSKREIAKQLWTLIESSL
ncbi:MAG: bifunctional phosphopantothenoylcysteine decarboxylase/phosphopantothenate--cysteine ligase CoaBC [Coriobacteriia bacterium]|nr:bifunctional phosphopantothenoylcysteine decarboxylase/phosphopantothenate--cysteine ligase CoaBC [Coriobacteriia bacterium]